MLLREKINTIKWKLGNQLTQTFVPFNVFPSEKWAHKEQRLESEGNVGKPKNQNELLCFRWWNWNLKTRINTKFFWNIGSFSFAWLCLHLPSNIKYTRFALFLLENCTLLIWGSTWSSIRETCIKAKKTMKYNLRKHKTGSVVLTVIMTPNERQRVGGIQRLLKSNEKSSCLRQKYRKELLLARHVMKRAPVGAMSKVSRRSSKKHPKNILKACYVNFL